MSVTIKMEFDPEDVLEEIPVGTSLEWRAEIRNRDDAQARQNGCILTSAMHGVLDHNMRDAVQFGLLRHANNHLQRLVLVEFVVLVPEAERVIWPVEWLPKIQSNWLRSNSWQHLQNDWLNDRCGGRMNSNDHCTRVYNGVPNLNVGDGPE